MLSYFFTNAFCYWKVMTKIPCWASTVVKYFFVWETRTPRNIGFWCFSVENSFQRVKQLHRDEKARNSLLCYTKITRHAIDENVAQNRKTLGFLLTASFVLFRTTMASLTSGFLNGKEAQAGASAAVQNDMQDLRAKAERQRVDWGKKG